MYGALLRNANDRLILDSTPFAAMEIVERGTYPNNTVIPNMTGTNQTLYVCATNISASLLGNKNPSNTADIMTTTDGGTISYVKTRSCNSLTPTGYGLAIYAADGSTGLIFTNQMAVARLHLYLQSYLAIMNYSLPANLANQRKYISANTLYGMHWHDSFIDFPSFASNADGSYITLGIHTQGGYTGANMNLLRNYTIIEA